MGAAEQLELPEHPPAPPQPLTTEEKFARMLVEHPEFYPAFERIAFDFIRRGFKRYSADGILHIIRYQTLLRDGTNFKCNNDFTALMSRRFNARNPEHKGFFQTRERRSK